MEFDLYISLPRYTVLVLVEDSIVVDAPPIVRWTVGRTLYQVVSYYKDQPGCRYWYMSKEPEGAY